MKVLFLDIDGVVNSEQSFRSGPRFRGVIGIEPYMAFLVGRIQLDTGCQIVLSSAWRNWPEGEREIEARIAKLYDRTGHSDSGIRGEEIQTWLDAHPDVDRYAILDDSSDMLPEQLPNFF